MKTPAKIVVVFLVIAAAIAVLALKKNKPAPNAESSSVQAAVVTNQVVATTKIPVKLPKLLDLGADKCIPCKMMAPVLKELKKDYEGKMDVEFIDVWQNPDAGKQYGIEMIPTQIFYNADGKEMFRHTGFFGKEDILGKWKELGVNLDGAK